MTSTVEELAEAIRALDDEARQALIAKLADDSEFVQDLLDTVDLMRSRDEAVRPYDEFASELDHE